MEKLLWVSGEIAMLEELGSSGDFPLLWPKGLGLLLPPSPERTKAALLHARKTRICLLM